MYKKKEVKEIGTISSELISHFCNIYQQKYTACLIKHYQTTSSLV